MKKTKTYLIGGFILLSIALFAYYYPSLKKRMLGNYTMETAYIIDTKRQSQNLGYYAQLVNYVFEYKGKIYEGEFTASEHMGLQSIGGIIKVGFHDKHPEHSSLERFNYGKKYYKHIRYAKFVQADSVGYRQINLGKRAFQLFHYSERAKLDSVLMGTVQVEDDEYFFCPRKQKVYLYKENEMHPYHIKEEIIQPDEEKYGVLKMKLHFDADFNFIEDNSGEKALYRRIKKR